MSTSLVRSHESDAEGRREDRDELTRWYACHDSSSGWGIADN